jgi:uncharacterized protein (TIGR03437 family)
MSAMSRAWPALAILFVGIARGGAPSYSAAGIVKAGSFEPGPFAPSSIVTIFGSELATTTQQLGAPDIHDNHLPIELAGTRVLVYGSPVPLFFISDKQINFLMPESQSKGPAEIRVVRDGLVGPVATVTIADAAPALFVASATPGYIIATHLDNTVVTADAPARAGELVVIYAAGLGKVERNPTDGEIPSYISPLVNLPVTRVLLNGGAVDFARILYAGLTPGCAGLYQINLQLPENLPADPELRVAIGDQISQPGVKLNVRYSGAQLSAASGR